MKLERISHLNFIMTLFILVLHTRAGSNFFGDSPAWYVFLDRYIVDLTTAAVPTFFSISAFLLFRNYTFSKYVQKIKSRIQSLVIPYFGFSVFAFLLMSLLSILKGTSIHFDLLTFTKDVYYCSFNSPIWYLRALFYYVVISPVVLYIFVRSKIVGLLALMFFSIVVNFLLEIPYDTFVYWLPDLVLFSYLGLYYPDFFSRPVFKEFIWICLFFVLILPLAVHDVDYKGWVYWVYRMILPVLYIPLSALFSWKPMKIYGGTFFVYMTHGIVNPVVYGIFKGYSGFNFFVPFLKPLFVILPCFFLYMFVSKFFPNLFKVINGGR